MKRSTILYTCFFAFILMASACQKEAIDPRLPYLEPIDPTSEPSRLSRALGILGDIMEGEMPLPTGGSSVEIQNTQTSAKISNGTRLFVPFTFAGGASLKEILLQIEGANTYWKIPVSSVSDDTYVFEIGLPEEVLPGNFKFQFALGDASGNISTSRTISTEVTLTEIACSEDDVYFESGSAGLTIRRIELGDTPGEVSISYQMYSLPDRLDIYYGDKWVASTGGNPLSANATPPPSVCFDGTPGYVPGIGTLTFQYDPAIAKDFKIYMSGCYGTTAWDFWVYCPGYECGGEVPTDILTPRKTLEFKSNQEITQSTGLFVNQGDYVFLSAKGAIVGGSDPLFGPIASNAAGVIIPSDRPQPLKPYADFRFCQLIAKVGVQQYGFGPFGLQGQDCSYVPDEWFTDLVYFTGEYGTYFIAPQSGELLLELNDLEPADNTGAFSVEIYVLSEQQHRNRNCYNKCPNKEPTLSLGASYTDHFDIVWRDGVFLDAVWEECYHGGYEDYRGIDDYVGCQCVYDDEGDLLVYDDLLNQGSFDFGYVDGEDDKRLHFILDVFPHVAWLVRDPNFVYEPTVFIY